MTQKASRSVGSRSAVVPFQFILVLVFAWVFSSFATSYRNDCTNQIALKTGWVAPGNTGIFYISPGQVFDPYQLHKSYNGGDPQGVWAYQYPYTEGVSWKGQSYTTNTATLAGPCANNCNKYFRVVIKNENVVPEIYQLYKGSSPLTSACSGSGVKSWAVLQPGEMQTLGLDGQCSTNDVGVMRLSGNWVFHAEADTNGVLRCWYTATLGSALPNLGGGSWAENAGGSPSTYMDNTASGSVYTPSLEDSGGSGAANTNGPIRFGASSTNNPASDSTLRTGFAALYEVLAKQTKIFDEYGSRVSAQLSGVSNLVSGVKDGVFALTSTNAAGFKSMVEGLAAVSATVSNSAFVGEHYQSNSLYFQTNLPWTENRSMWGTNYDSANALYQSSAMKAGEGTIESFSGSFVAGSMAGEDGGSGGPSIAIPLGSHAITASLMPGDFSAMWDFMRGLASWILVAAYFVRVIDDSSKAVKYGMDIRPLRIPDLAGTIFGVGGNWGIVAFPFIVGAFMVIQAALLAGIINLVTGHTDYLTLFLNGPVGSGPIGGAVAGGVSWIRKAFPIGLLFDLVVAYILFKIAIMKLHWVAVGVTKWLLG